MVGQLQAQSAEDLRFVVGVGVSQYCRDVGERHPQIVIGTFGPAEAWQALIPEERGETVVTRHDLRALLDRLDELTGDRTSGSG